MGTFQIYPTALGFAWRYVLAGRVMCASARPEATAQACHIAIERVRGAWRAAIDTLEAEPDDAVQPVR
jgi:hypothetical protein